MPTRVLIVEDSQVMQRLLADLIGRGPDLEVAGVASDPYEARELVKALKPDVMTLDVEMPRMDGITFLERLMRLHPMPVVMVSSLTERDAEASLRALELGALDVIAKPRATDGQGLAEFGASIADKLRAAARAAVATAAILTGMGGDGAEGLRKIKAAGGYTLAQDEASCVVFGMPKIAIETGCVDRVAAPTGIAERIMQRIIEWPRGRGEN